MHCVAVHSWYKLLCLCLQTFPGNLLSSTYPDPQNRRRIIGRSEVERRGRYIGGLRQLLGGRHPLVQLVERCLDNDPTYRPSAMEVLQQLEGLEIEDPHQHLSKLDVIHLLQQRDQQIQRLQTELQQTQVY